MSALRLLPRSRAAVVDAPRADAPRAAVRIGDERLLFAAGQPLLLAPRLAPEQAIEVARRSEHVIVGDELSLVRTTDSSASTGRSDSARPLDARVPPRRPPDAHIDPAACECGRELNEGCAWRRSA